MAASVSSSSSSVRRSLGALACAAVVAAAAAVALPLPAAAQDEGIDPVTDAELQDPSPDDWLMWRRTLDGWGF